MHRAPVRPFVPALRALRIAVGALCPFFLAACSTTPAPYARPYPTDVPRGPTVNIQAVKGDTTVELTNTTAIAYGPSTLWLNRRFCRPIDGLAVGQTLEYRLHDFQDEFHDVFKKGGFWAIERPDRLVVAEIETVHDAKPMMVELIVIGQPED